MLCDKEKTSLEQIISLQVWSLPANSSDGGKHDDHDRHFLAKNSFLAEQQTSMFQSSTPENKIK